MSRILIVYGTTEGFTEKVAKFLARTLETEGAHVRCLDVREVRPGMGFEDYCGIILGSSIHMGRHDRALIRFVERHRPALDSVPTAMFTVCMAAASDTEEAQRQVADYEATFRAASGLEPALYTTFAGALRYTKYGFFKRFIMRSIAKRTGAGTETDRDHEYTDWAEVSRFGQAFAKKLGLWRPVFAA